MGSNRAIQLNYNSNNTIDLLARINGNGLFFSDSVNLVYDSQSILANFNNNWDENWAQLIDGTFLAYYTIPHYELINSDPVSSDKYFITEINDTLGNYISSGKCLHSLDSNGSVRYVRKLSENNSSSFYVNSLTINNSHESIVKCKIEDTTKIGNITYIPNQHNLHLIFKITKPGSIIKGKVFYDIDGDGVINNGEQGIQTVPIQIENKNIYLVSDTGGYYNFYCDTGYYKVSIVFDSLCEQSHPTNPFYYSVDILTDSTIIDNSDFGIYCSDTSGVFDFKIHEMSLFPNPTNGRFIVDIEEFEKIELLNSRGQVVYATKQKEIDISNQPAGVYIILIFQNKVIIRGKIIKE